LQLTANTGFEDGQWIFFDSPNTPEFININDLNPMIIFPESGTYNLAYNDLTCPDGDSISITLISSAYVELPNDTICLGEPYQLEAFLFGQNDSYEWSTGETTPSISISSGGEYSITATNVCGTFTATSIITAILCDFEIPNVFSPNGDNNNDNFTLLFSDGMEQFSMVIVNRWGNVMREFDQPDFAWDGKDSAGNEASEGVYFYKAIGTLIGGKELIKQGFVHLVRE
jgi:gliding motility-associated-like protein